MPARSQPHSQRAPQRLELPVSDVAQLDAPPSPVPLRAGRGLPPPSALEQRQSVPRDRRGGRGRGDVWRAHRRHRVGEPLPAARLELPRSCPRTGIGAPGFGPSAHSIIRCAALARPASPSYNARDLEPRRQNTLLQDSLPQGRAMGPAHIAHPIPT
jgi:hypothetical protein